MGLAAPKKLASPPSCCLLQPSSFFALRSSTQPLSTMAITWRERRELDRLGSRQLRSERPVHTLPEPFVRRSGHSRKTCPPRSLLVAHRGLIGEGAASEQPREHEEGRSHYAVLGLPSVSNRIRPQPLAATIVKYVPCSPLSSIVSGPVLTIFPAAARSLSRGKKSYLHWQPISITWTTPSRRCSRRERSLGRAWFPNHNIKCHNGQKSYRRKCPP